MIKRAAALLLGLLLGSFVAGVALAATPPSGISPGTTPFGNQAAAGSACEAFAQWYVANVKATITKDCYVTGAEAPAGYSTAAQCTYDTASYNLQLSSGTYQPWMWCLNQQCKAGNVVQDGAFDPTTRDTYFKCKDGCLATFTPSTQWASIRWQNGNGADWGTYKQTGATCTAPTYTTAPVPPPKPCDGQSCFDPNKGFCAVTEAGEQVCTGAPSSPGSGGCGAGSTGAVCAGNSPAPPPTPPNPPVPSGQPPDNTTTATTTGGSGCTSGCTTTINNYGTGTPLGGNPTGTCDDGSSGTSNCGGLGGTSNGNGSGNSDGGTGDGTDSNGKCGDGSVPTASGCSGAFNDSGCTNPPQASGDAELSGIIKETWATRCSTQQVATALGVGSSTGGSWGNPAENSGDPTASQVTQSVNLGDTSQLDSSGFGYGTTCPAEDMTVDLGGAGTFDIPFSKACDFGLVLRAFVLAFAYFYAAKVIAGVK